MFYCIYWSGLFTPYSWLLLCNEMLEQFLFIVDPVVYISMSTELRHTLNWTSIVTATVHGALHSMSHRKVSNGTVVGRGKQIKSAVVMAIKENRRPL